jgi:hypothetical protein
MATPEEQADLEFQTKTQIGFASIMSNHTNISLSNKQNMNMLANAGLSTLQNYTGVNVGSFLKNSFDDYTYSTTPYGNLYKPIGE